MLSQERRPQLVDLKSSMGTPVGSALEKVLALSTLNRLYEQSLQLYDRVNYFPTVLRVLNIQYELTDEDRNKLPTSGPLVVVANHPFGAIDGVILGDILTRVRGDVRLLGNQHLSTVPEIRNWVIPIDPYGGAAAAHSNVAAVKSCVRWLRRGGAVGVFPAGTVSHLRLRQARISDPEWHEHVARLVRATGATVVPMFFEGRNSMVFQLAGLIHPLLRTALLPSELLKRSNSSVSVRIGRPIGPEKIDRYPDDDTLIDYLRFKTYMLKRRESPIRPRFVPRATPPDAKPVPVAEPVPSSVLGAEVGRLSGETLMVEQGNYQIFVTEARAIPAVLREIGRLRELTFRAVAEGTGRALDIDAFDESYLHLFMWNKVTSEVVGSYRIGRVDQLLAKGGVASLYTSSLFKFDGDFLRRLGPALELGRSFIRAEYQRKPTSLALIWRGIGEFLVRHPHYKILFGPVSISRAYQSVSKRLMVEFLGQQHGDDRFGPLVRAKNPPKDRLDRHERQLLESVVKDADDISALVSEIEEDNKGMPVLLRHYLRLNARILSFNVDPAFGYCIDGLIIVDLRTTDPKILRRFMGAEGHTFYASVT